MNDVANLLLAASYVAIAIILLWRCRNATLEVLVENEKLEESLKKAAQDFVTTLYNRCPMANKTYEYHDLVAIEKYMIKRWKRRQ